MGELANCEQCNAVFIKTTRDICPTCYKKEEEEFQKVYQFLRQQKNRESTIPVVVQATGVEEKLIIKFVRQKRLLTSQFPKLTYPCEKCQTPIITGRICANCSQELLRDLESLEKTENVTKNKEQSHTYYTLDKHKEK